MLRDEYVREDGHVESEGVLTVKGIDHKGYREILSVFVAPAEEEATWSAVFSDLIDRGLDPREVYSVVSDEHKGLKKALRRYFPKTIWQRCQTHYQRNAASKVTKKARHEVHQRLRDIFDAPNLELAQRRASRMILDYQNRFPDLASWLEETINETLAVFLLPREHHKRLRTTNGLERYHQEVNRRTNVVRIFPNRASCLRLVSALAMEQSEDWLTGHRYLPIDLLEEETIPMQITAPSASSRMEPSIPDPVPA
ncbi:MAG: transposase [Anaerolineales bacterium]|jgi:transposase-like protein